MKKEHGKKNIRIPHKQQREREWEDAQRKQQSEDLETEE